MELQLVTILGLLYFLFVGIVCIRILLDTNSSSKAFSYIILVILIPLAGIVFYFSVGVNYRKHRLYQKKLKITGKAFSDLERLVQEFSSSTIEASRLELSQFSSLAQYCAKECLSSKNNNVDLLINGEGKFPAFLDSIRKAKHHIHIEYYIFEDDEIGSEVANLLIEKAQQGVEVRFIYDDFGSKGIRGDFLARMRKAGVEAVPFYKLKLIYLANRLNYRNHRKILVVDGIVGFVGGINISDKYYNNRQGQLYWRDTHLKIVGMSVLNLQFIFLTDWNFCAKQDINFSTAYFPHQQRQIDFGNKLVQIIASGPDSRHPSIMYNLIQAILLAKNEILITTPYFVPEKSFLDALKIASLSGVKIKILVPEESDSAFVNTACKYYYQELLDVGVKVYLYTKGFVHAKTLVCDEFLSVVGTANLDNRSFDLNFEVNALVYDRELTKSMKEHFYNDLKNATQIDVEKWNSRPFYIRTLEKIAHLFSPLL